MGPCIFRLFGKAEPRDFAAKNCRVQESSLLTGNGSRLYSRLTNISFNYPVRRDLIYIRIDIPTLRICTLSFEHVDFK